MGVGVPQLIESGPPLVGEEPPPVSLDYGPIYVCGCPSAGNRILKRLLKEQGIATYIVHYADGLEAQVRGQRKAGKNPRVVIPVRDADCLCASLEARMGDWRDERFGGPSDVVASHYLQTLKAVAELSLPVAITTYEELVRDPEHLIGGLCEWAGVPFVGVRSKVVDGNEKWLST